MFYGLPFDIFKNYLETQIARCYQSVSLYDTPTIIYIMYVDDVPVGYIGLRTEIDDSWKKWSGNLFYVIRKFFRGKGYGNKILELGLDVFRKMNYWRFIVNPQLIIFILLMLLKIMVIY